MIRKYANPKNLQMIELMKANGMSKVEKAIKNN